MLSKGKFMSIELVSYLMLILGTFGDHISTVIALTQPYIYETNPVTIQLMSRGLWLPVDLILIALGIGIPYLLIRFSNREYIKAVLAYPLVHGVVRLGACIWNISLII